MQKAGCDVYDGVANGHDLISVYGSDSARRGESLFTRPFR